VCDYFIAVKLQYCARGAFACSGVVDGGHAALEGEQASAQWCAMSFSLEGGGRCAVQCGLAGLVREAVGTGRVCGFDGSDAYRGQERWLCGGMLDERPGG
jgi:hypothetical protein